MPRQPSNAGNLGTPCEGVRVSKDASVECFRLITRGAKVFEALSA
jgi:hypothetical protein